jgi:hypothetical protein
MSARASATRCASGKFGGKVVPTVRQANLFQQCFRSFAMSRVIFRDHRWHQDVLQQRTLLQQAVALEHVPDLFVSKRSGIPFR